MATAESGEYDIKKRSEWILRLLYAPDRHGRNKQPLFGKTRLMKATFLLHRKLEEHFNGDIQTGFDFRPDKYGPLDPDVYSAVSLLENQGDIEVLDEEDHDDKYDLVKYKLTQDGAKRAATLYEDLSPEKQELVDWVKAQHAMKPLGELLSFVYDNYPEMTTKSELV